MSPRAPRQDGLENWRKAVERIERPLPMLIENTAGGDGAMARSLDAIGRLWDAVTEARPGTTREPRILPGHLPRELGRHRPRRRRGPDQGHHRPDRPGALQQLARRVRLGPGPARQHRAGTIDPALLLGVVRAAGAPVICETPDADGGLAADVRWLQQQLAS